MLISFSIQIFVLSIITVEDGVGLCRKSDMDEVRHVVFSINPYGVIGLDGFFRRFN